MKDATWAHVVVFIAALIFLAAIIITGHDNSPLLTTLLTGVVGGAGGAGLGSALASFFKGPDQPTGVAPLTTRQGGFVRAVFIPVLFVVSLGIAACAGLTSAPSTGTTATAISEGCATASAAIKSLTVVEQAGKLTPDDVQGVNAALAIVNPLCEASAPPDATQVTLDAITSAAAELTALQVKYHATATGP